jgi:hypothetical protein
LGKEKVKYRNTYRRVVYQVDDIAVAAGKEQQEIAIAAGQG